jgi:hypothetical protein
LIAARKQFFTAIVCGDEDVETRKVNFAMNRYEELQKAGKKTEQLFYGYKNDCREFVSKMRQEFADYLECNVEKIKWLFFSDEDISNYEKQPGFIEYSGDKRMVLFEDTFSTFALGIILGLDNEFPPSRFDVRLKVKKEGEYFIIRYDKTDLKVHQENEDDWEKLIEYVYVEMKKFLENSFESFIKGNKKTFGFITRSSTDSAS